jgi:hypothetical protein
MTNYELIIKATQERCKARREAGAEEYGDLSFEDKDTLKELLEELYDIINYAHFTIVKVETLRLKMNAIERKHRAVANKQTP